MLTNVENWRLEYDDEEVELFILDGDMIVAHLGLDALEHLINPGVQMLIPRRSVGGETNGTR